MEYFVGWDIHPDEPEDWDYFRDILYCSVLDLCDSVEPCDLEQLSLDSAYVVFSNSRSSHALNRAIERNFRIRVDEHNKIALATRGRDVPVLGGVLVELATMPSETLNFRSFEYP